MVKKGIVCLWDGTQHSVHELGILSISKEFLEYICSPGCKHNTGDVKLQIAKFRIWQVNAITKGS